MHVIEQEPKDDQTTRNTENPGKEIFHEATSNSDVACCTIEVKFRVNVPWRWSWQYRADDHNRSVHHNSMPEAPSKRVRFACETLK